jgi:hypothetical protein
MKITEDHHKKLINKNSIFNLDIRLVW